MYFMVYQYEVMSAIAACAHVVQYHWYLYGLPQDQHRGVSPGRHGNSCHRRVVGGILHVAVQEHEKLGIPTRTPQIQDR